VTIEHRTLCAVVHGRRMPALAPAQSPKGYRTLVGCCDSIDPPAGALPWWLLFIVIPEARAIASRNVLLEIAGKLQREGVIP
jgi:hypothetical protein